MRAKIWPLSRRPTVHTVHEAEKLIKTKYTYMVLIRRHDSKLVTI